MIPFEHDMLSAFEFIELVAEAEDGDMALKLIEELQPDVAFLDIEMPAMSGMTLAQHPALRSSDVRIVFVTAYDQFAVQAFETQAVDYLLKPVSAARLAQCIDAIQHGRRASLLSTDADTQKAEHRQLSIRHGAAVRLIDVDHIAWLESVEGYCRVWLSDAGQLVHKQSSLITDTSLAQTQRLLSAPDFLRVSRSAIINTRFVVRHWTQQRRMFIVLRGYDEQAIGVSRRNAALIRMRWP